MRTNKKMLSALPLLAMLGMGDIEAMGNTYREPLTKKEIEQLKEKKKKLLAQAEEERRLRQGQQKFFYGESFVWALNKTNADRKAYKKGILK